MKWINLETESVIDTLRASSDEKPVLIFKHSTRCPISAMAIQNFEKEWKSLNIANADVYYLNVIEHRPVSMAVADVFNVEHQSPQLLLIKNGECEANWSHMMIASKKVVEELKKLAN